MNTTASSANIALAPDLSMNDNLRGCLQMARDCGCDSSLSFMRSSSDNPLYPNYNRPRKRGKEKVGSLIT